MTERRRRSAQEKARDRAEVHARKVARLEKTHARAAVLARESKDELDGEVARLNHALGDPDLSEQDREAIREISEGEERLVDEDDPED